MYMLDAGWWGHRGVLGVARKALLHGVLWAMMGASLLAAKDLPALPLSMLILLGVAFLVEARRHVHPLRELPIAVWGKALGRSMQLLSFALLLWWLLWISGCGDSGVGVDSGESGGCGSGSRLWGGALRASLVADLGCDLSALAPGVHTAKSSCFAAYLMWASPFFCAVLLLVLSNVVLFSTLYVRYSTRLTSPRVASHRVASRRVASLATFTFAPSTFSPPLYSFPTRFPSFPFYSLFANQPGTCT